SPTALPRAPLTGRTCPSWPSCALPSPPARSVSSTSRSAARTSGASWRDRSRAGSIRPAASAVEAPSCLWPRARRSSRPRPPACGPGDNLGLADREIEPLPAHHRDQHRELQLAPALDPPGVRPAGVEAPDRHVPHHLLVEAPLHQPGGEFVAVLAGERRGVDA